MIFPIVFAHSLDPAAGEGLIFGALPAVFAGMPAGIGFGLKGAGYTKEDLEDLTKGAIPRRRPIEIDNAPLPISCEL